MTHLFMLRLIVPVVESGVCKPGRVLSLLLFESLR